MQERIDIIMFCIIFILAWGSGINACSEERVLNWLSLILMIISVGIGYKLVFGS